MSIELSNLPTAQKSTSRYRNYDTESIAVMTTQGSPDITPTQSRNNLDLTFSGRDHQESLAPEELEYPDGGFRAYLVVAGSFCGAVTCLGLVNSIGAIQAYVSTHQLAHLSASTISWIFSIYLSLTYALGIVTGPIFDYHGSRGLLLVASALIFGGLMGAANSTKIYQFILSFICLGVGNGVGLTPVVSVLNHWFLKKRGFMTGLVTSGGSMGGLVFPLLLRYLFDNYDYVWALRILAFVASGCVVVSVIFSKERFVRDRPPKNSNQIITRTENGRAIQFNYKNLFDKLHKATAKHRDRTFILTVIGSFCTELALVLTVTYFVTYAMAQGMSESTGYLLLSIWNACSFPGRIFPGLASDYLGKFNVHIIMVAGETVFIFIIWLGLGSNPKALYAFAAIGGFFLGLILGMIPACIAQISVVSEFGERYGILNFCLSFGNLVGVPIGAAIIDDGSQYNYNMFVVLIGCLMAVGTLFFVLARGNLAKQLVAKV